MTAPTKSEREYWQKLRDIGCIICGSSPAIHHCGTGMGGRKDHRKVLPLCHHHHQGPEGLHTLSRRVWQAKYGTEDELMKLTHKRLIAENMV